MTFGAIVCSFRPNEIRLEDIIAHVGDMDRIGVRVIDEAGQEQLITVTFGQKWGATGWRRELQCAACISTARVLHVAGGRAVCCKCWPVLTSHHRHKNAVAWQSEGAVLDKIIRSVLKWPAEKSQQARRRLGARLVRGSSIRAIGVIEQAQRVIKGADCVLRSRFTASGYPGSRQFR
jgi:hypothetical protein